MWAVSGYYHFMYFNEHRPLHFHAVYNDEHKASISIQRFGVIEGKLPSRVLSLVVEWAQEHQSELFANWETLQSSGKYAKVKPLVQGIA